MRLDAQIGGPALGGQVGSAQLPGAAGAFDPTSFAWLIATCPDLTPRWRRATAESFIHGPELPQPTLAASTRPWEIARSAEPTPSWRRQTLSSSTLLPPFPQPNVDPSTLGFGITSEQRWAGMVPRWRRTTMPSWVSDSTTTDNPAQQIQLLGRAINHRRMGTIRLTGGDLGLKVFISQIDQSATFAAASCHITRQLGTTGQCTVVFNVPSGGFTPVRGASFVITENNRTLFSGLIVKRTHEVYPNTTMSRWTIAAVDWNGLLQRHLIAKDYSPASLLSVAADILLQPSINLDRISAAGVDPAISVGDAFSFSYIKMSDAFTQMSLSTNTIWWIDNYKVLHQILPANCPASNYSVVETGAQQSDPAILVEDSDDNARNTQYVRSHQQLLPASVTVTDSHTFTGATGDIVCITRYPLTSAPQSVLENGVEIVNSNRFFELKPGGGTVYPSGGEGYYWSVGFFGIWHWPSNQYPVNGTTMSVTYTGVSVFAGNVVVFKDSGDIIARQAISGGSGILEEIEDYSGTLTYDQGIALATGIEQSTIPVPSVITVSTIEPVEDIGYAVTVNLPRWGITGTYVVQQIDCTADYRDLGKGTRFRTKIQLVSARTLGNFTQYFERLEARLNKASQSAPTEKPSWDLAFDSPGNVSAGLQSGTFGSDWPVQVALGRIQRVVLLFKTAADANIVIDLLLNGASIFDSAKATYTPAMTGTQQLYANLTANSVNVKQGDRLTLVVVSCGTVAPGKNGTVIVVIGQR